MAEALNEKRRATLTVGGVSVEWGFLVIVMLGTLLPMCDYYGHHPTKLIVDRFPDHLSFNLSYDRFFSFFVIPILVITLLFRESPAKYGVAIGKWREGLVWMLVVCPIITVILWFLVRNSAMAQWYLRRANDSPLQMIWFQGVELFGWDYMWRGFWLFGLARVIGIGPAIVMQAVPFAIFHLGKPEIETFTTLFGGIGFGFIAWRCRSFIYAWLIHWFILVMTILIALYAQAHPVKKHSSYNIDLNSIHSPSRIAAPILLQQPDKFLREWTA